MQMRTKTTVGALLAVVMLAIGCGEGDLPVDEQAAPESGPSAQAYRSCSAYDGTSCSSPGSSFTCYNQYPYEPGLCVCGGDYTRSCS